MLKDEFVTILQNEKQMAKYSDDTCPREITNCNMYELLNRLKEEKVEQEIKGNYSIIFILDNEITSKIVRAIQEDQLLKTKIKMKSSSSSSKDKVITLKSFWEVWESNSSFRNEILSSSDANEEKWKLSRKYKYKLATTFMPAYAKSIYEYFHCPEIVLDPCSGWGDRLLAAEISGVKKYIGFDPNKYLRPGYVDIMSLCGHLPVQLSSDYIQFQNTYEIHSIPFEQGVLSIEDNSIDFIFTSPPFFDYEIYSDMNPHYRNWIKEFYEPLFQQCSRVVKPNGFVCIYLSDTTAGNIERFLTETVGQITPLVLQKPIGFKGIWSSEIRKIHVFQKK
jgi:hypothetical protein